MAHENLERLRELTDFLPELRVLLTETPAGCVKQVGPDGAGCGWGIFNQDEIAVLRWYSPAGSVFPYHIHEEREWIFVYRGTVEYQREGTDPVIMSPEETPMMEVQPGAAHRITFVTQAWLVCLTMPASEHYPK